MTALVRGVRRSYALVLVALATACADAPTSPQDAAAPAFQLENDFTVVHLHLRPDAGSETQTRGELTVFVGAAVPPSPCNAPDGSTVAFCGVIHNPAGELFTGATLTIQASRDAAPVVLELAAPPSPCTSYLLRGGTGADLGVPGINLPAVQVVFSFEGGSLVGYVNPGPPNGPSRDPGVAPGPPNAPPSPCLVGLSTRTG